MGRNDLERYVNHTFVASSIAARELIHFGRLLNWIAPPVGRSSLLFRHAYDQLFPKAHSFGLHSRPPLKINILLHIVYGRRSRQGDREEACRF